jgi:tetratricopeptide (TPR) repeat protein
MKPWMLAIPILLAALGCKTTQTETYGPVQYADSSENSVLDSRLRQLETLSKEYPKKSEYPYQMAGVYYQKEDYKGTAKALEKAIFIDPDEPKYHYHLGRIYLQMRELDLAGKSFRRAIELMPSDRYTGPRGALGYVLCQQGKWAEAAVEYDACARIDPSDPTPYYYLGCIHDRLGNKEKATASLTEYIRRGGTTYRTAASRILSAHGVTPPEPEGEPIEDATPRGTDLGEFPGGPRT